VKTTSCKGEVGEGILKGTVVIKSMTLHMMLALDTVDVLDIPVGIVVQS
jgi:hypothetical protein